MERETIKPLISHDYIKIVDEISPTVDIAISVHGSGHVASDFTRMARINTLATARLDFRRGAAMQNCSHFKTKHHATSVKIGQCVSTSDIHSSFGSINRDLIGQRDGVALRLRFRC